MSHPSSHDYLHSNKRPRLQEPSGYEANPPPNIIEPSTFPDTISAAAPPNIHDPWNASAKEFTESVITRVPQPVGSLAYPAFGPAPGPDVNVLGPSFHGRPQGGLTPFTNHHTLRPNDGAPAATSSFAFAVANTIGYQDLCGAARNTMGQGPLPLPRAASEIDISHHAGHHTVYPHYGFPFNGQPSRSGVYQPSRVNLDTLELPVGFQKPNPPCGPARYQHDGCVTGCESLVNPPDTGSDLICFGMFVGISGTCGPPPLDQSSSYPVTLENPGSFVGTQDPNLKGDIDIDFVYLTEALLEEPRLELQLVCTLLVDPPKVTSNGKHLRVSGLTSRCSLDIILYGPIDLSDPICTFIEECNEHLEDQPKLYLQDPVGCDRNVRYCNPHRLPPLDPNIHRFTFDMANRRQIFTKLENLEPLPELLGLLDSQEDLPEAVQPPAIVTTLKRHQKQALTFMLRREQGWVFDGTRPDIWEAVDSARGLCFANRISDARQVDEPPNFYGGIIADPMGFGKTLAMIALIASDSQYLASNDSSDLTGVLREQSCGLTLVVVPPPLLGTWEDELKCHVEPLRLPWLLHHGKSRLINLSQLERTVVVLTTYHTVSTEWRSGGGRESSILFKTRWRRVVLDEAHFIRNSDSQMARAVCALESVSRWAVTGTPVQNHLNDLAALLKFLSVYPYNEKRVFDADISQLWKAGNTEEAVKRLKRLAGCLLLRRPKKTIELPPRHDQACYVQFQREERDLYDQVKMQTIARLDEALLQGNNYGGRATSYVSILQQIEAMRMVCNLGLLYPSRHDSLNMMEKGSNADDWHETAQSGFNVRFEMGSIQCHCCPFVLDATNNSLDDTETVKAIFARCLRFICSSCAQRSTHDTTAFGCGHIPPCPMAYISTSAASLEAPPVPISLGSIAGSAYLPTKVQALIENLQTLPGDVKSVVFSTWRMTLDVVEAGLNHAGIPALRFDGKVPQRERHGVVDRFRNDPTIRVMLLTLSCGAVGLTLTTASRAYLMEPHWNPTLEDQALARIHRIGQEKEVTTLRFYVRDSFEESVVKNQQFKRELAGILLAPNGVTTNDLGHLERLRALI